MPRRGGGGDGHGREAGRRRSEIDMAVAVGFEDLAGVRWLVPATAVVRRPPSVPI
jgi:hypothetical protein